MLQKRVLELLLKTVNFSVSERTLIKIVDSGETTRQAKGRLELTYSFCVLRTAKQDAFGLKIEHKVGLF